MGCVVEMCREAWLSLAVASLGVWRAACAKLLHQRRQRVPVAYIWSARRLNTSEHQSDIWQP